MTLKFDQFFSAWFLKTMQPSWRIELVIIYFEQLNRMIKQERALFLSKLHPEHSTFFRIKKSVPRMPKLVTFSEAAQSQLGSGLIDLHYH